MVRVSTSNGVNTTFDDMNDAKAFAMDTILALVEHSPLPNGNNTITVNTDRQGNITKIEAETMFAYVCVILTE